MMGQIQERVYHIEPRNKDPTNAGRNVRMFLYRVYIKCLDKFNSGFTKSKQWTKFLQTQAEMYGYVL